MTPFLSSSLRRSRAMLRPAKLGARRSAAQGSEVIQSLRELAYDTARTRSSYPAWCIPPGGIAVAWFRKGDNFGDLLSPMLIGAATGRRPLWVSPDFEGKVVGVGSVLTYARPGDIVVGSGLIRPQHLDLSKRVQIIAVRGPLTAALVGADKTGLLFGDPGMVAAEYFGIAKAATPEFDVALVPHSVDQTLVSERIGRHPERDRMTFVDVHKPPLHVVKSIANARVVISSSLHGIVIAESLGVPAVWVTISGDLTGGNFKFNDYFLGTGRAAQSPLDFESGLRKALEGSAAPYLSDPTQIRQALSQLASSCERVKP